MKWASAVSEQNDAARALAEVAGAVREQLAGGEPDLLVAFISPHHAKFFADLPAALHQWFPRALLLGCTGGGVIGAGREIEQRAGFSLTAAVLPGVAIQRLRVPASTDIAEDHAPAPWPLGGDTACHMILLADPFSTDAEVLLRGLDSGAAGGTRIGGLASGGDRPGVHALWLGGHTFRDGAVGVALRGNVEVDAVVAQGCRPIGEPALIARCEGNRVRLLDERTPLQVLRSVAEGLDERDRELFRSSLMVGLEMRTGEVEFQDGEFLIRRILSLDPDNGSIALAALPQPWQVLQFHLRDARSSADDLGHRLERYHAASRVGPSGALLFSCLGRGEGLYGKPDHDSQLFRQYLGPVPLGGFFCNGEIGEVGGTAFLHTFTSSFGLFRPRD